MGVNQQQPTQHSARQVALELVQKHVGQQPASPMAFVYWDVKHHDKTGQKMIVAGIAGGIVQTIASQFAGQLAAGSLLTDTSSYSGKVGMLAVVGNELILVPFGEVAFGKANTPVLTEEHLKEFLALGDVVVERNPLAGVWCSAGESSPSDDSSVLFHGAIAHQVSLLKTYPADVLGAVTSAQQFVDAVNALALTVAPERFLEMAGTGAHLDRALLEKVVGDKAYLDQVRSRLVRLPRAKKESTIEGLCRFPEDIKVRLAAFLRSEAASRRKSIRKAWLWLLLCAAALAAEWALMTLTRKSYGDFREVLKFLGGFLVLPFGILAGFLSWIALLLIGAGVGGGGSAKWLIGTAEIIEESKP